MRMASASYSKSKVPGWLKIRCGATHASHHSASAAVEICRPTFDHAAYTSQAEQRIAVHWDSRMSKASFGFEGCVVAKNNLEGNFPASAREALDAEHAWANDLDH